MAEADVLVRTRIERYRAPAGDPGWFGPASVAWQVHADLPSMLVGGLSALMLQTLHPKVMQGVEDHSGYRFDPFGRLQRTAEFIAGTTYGSDALATELVERVRRIHAVVAGDSPAGPYRASDPELLTYVHVTEVWSFLRAHQRYSGHLLLAEEKERYLEEMSIVAHRLGAGPVPVRTAAVREYLRSARPGLEGTQLARRTVRFLTSSPFGGAVIQRYAYATICEAAIDLLPSWARSALGLFRPVPVRVALVRPAALGLTTALRVVVGSSPLLAAAKERAGNLPREETAS
jgi:uncharacterized protein (DUF2236 family)